LKILKISLGLALSLGFGYLAVRGVEWAAVLDSFGRVDLGLLALSFLWLGVIFFFRAYRWQKLVEPVQRLRVSVFFSATLIGFMGNNVLPLRAGEILRVYALSRLGPVPMSTSIATGALDRLLDMITVSLFVVLSLPYLTPLAGYAKGSVIFLGVMLALLFGGWWLVRGESRTWLAWLPQRLQRIAGELLDSLQVLRQGSLFLQTFLASIAVWATMVIYYWLLLKVCGFSLPFEAALVVVLFVAVGVALPAAPGFVGVFQYTIVLGLSFYAVPKEEALSFSIVAFFAQYIPITLGGLVLLLRSGLSLWPSDLALAKD
jgi:uncharacterized protein (TIRG00374 family)